MNKYTLLGLLSVLIWASLVACVKLVTESLSPVQGVALIYSFSALCILVCVPFPNIKRMSKTYLLGCGAFFVCYEILFLVSIAISSSREQVMVIAMINYLWPPLTIVFSILAKQLDYRWWVIPGFFISVMGLMLVVNPDVLNLNMFIQTLAQNPLAYLFAFIGALLWPCYSVLTKQYGQGQNGVPLFFSVTAVALWLVHFILNEPFVMPPLMDWGAIAIIGSLIGIAYSNWNQSLQWGNIKILILATYFIPVFSSVVSMVLLGVQPQLTFWMGTLLVSVGAVICWKSTAEIQN